MKTNLVIARLLALATGCLLSSCVAYDEGRSPSSGYGGAIYHEPPGPYVGGYYSQPGPVPFGIVHGGYRDDPRVDHDLRRLPHGHDGRLDKDNLRIVGGPLGGKDKPEGIHSAEWYRDRGYNLNKLKVEDKDGTPFRPGSSRPDRDDKPSRPDKDDKPSRDHDSPRHRDDDDHRGGGRGKH
jgi:hypothetical protein